MGAKGAVEFPVLEQFSEAVRSWFLDTFKKPTALQEQAWSVIEEGHHVLVVAPTGSGKTLAAFLFAIDKLMQEKATGALASKKKQTSQGARVLYISPLKALGADIDRNLQEPLMHIATRAGYADTKTPGIRTGMRTGDTPPEQRRALVRNPPDILITTPESLYLMLTSQARETLRCVETIIVDEVHALAGNKRGAHLALSLERLDKLLEHPAQRIGLSATVYPQDEIARFLGGSHAVQIVAAKTTPCMDIRIVVPVRDMTAIPPQESADMRREKLSARVSGAKRGVANAAWKSDKALRQAMAQKMSGTPDSRVGTSSIWPHIEAAILDEVLSHRTTIVFVNSRGLCEKLTARINELYAKRLALSAENTALMPHCDDEEIIDFPVHIRSDLGSTSELASGSLHIIAKAHHGSVAKEKRLQVEHELKVGELPCVVATSSLELGIDMGSVDLVLQVAPPPSVASGLQRVGRANHQVGGCSEGSFYPRTRTEIIDSVVVSEGMQQGLIEKTTLIQNPLDVLAQQTVAAVAMDEITADNWYATVCRTASFSELPRRAFDAVLDMLAGRHTSADLTEFSPRIVWDRESGLLTPRPSAQRLAVMSAGTIPDRGMFSVVLPEGGGNEGRRRV